MIIFLLDLFSRMIAKFDLGLKNKCFFSYANNINMDDIIHFRQTSVLAVSINFTKCNFLLVFSIY